MKVGLEIRKLKKEEKEDLTVPRNHLQIICVTISWNKTRIKISLMKVAKR